MVDKWTDELEQGDSLEGQKLGGRSPVVYSPLFLDYAAILPNFDKENEDENEHETNAEAATARLSKSLPGSPSIMPNVDFKMVLTGVDGRKFASLSNGRSDSSAAATNFRSYVKTRAQSLGVTGNIRRIPNSWDIVLEFEGSWDATSQFRQFLTECQTAGMVGSIQLVERRLYKARRHQTFEVMSEEDSFLRRSLQTLMYPETRARARSL
jgi:acylphosphatase